MGKRSLQSGAVLFLAAVGACTTVDPMSLSADGRKLDQVRPVPYRVAVAPVENFESVPREDDVLTFTFDRDVLQAELVRELAALNAATEVFAVGADAMRDATVGNADLLVRPRMVETPAFEEIGDSDRWWISVAFTMFTGPVNAWVEATTYKTAAAMEFTVETPHSPSAVASSLARVDQVDLTHWERHDAATPATFFTILWPSMWMWDDDDKTQESLTHRTCKGIAVRFTKFLKDELRGLQLQSLGDLSRESPANGGVVQADALGRVALRGVIEARHPIHALDVFVDDSTEPVLELRDAELGDPTSQRRVNGYEVSIDEKLELDPGDHTLAIEVVIRGQLTTRTYHLRVEA